MMTYEHVQRMHGIEPQDGMEHFITAARPKEVPARLRGLPADARITYEHNIAGWKGSGVTSAGKYRTEIEANIQRQGEGFFTLTEAAQVLADSSLGLDPTETVKRFRIAHSKGALPVHEHGSRFLLEVGETIRDYYDLLEVSELDAYLRKSAGSGFPAAVSQSAQVPHQAGTTHSMQTSKVNKVESRRHALSGVIAKARATATDGRDYLTVWPELVRIATGKDRPAELVGYVEGEGVQYLADTGEAGIKYFTKKALKEMFAREAKARGSPLGPAKTQ